MSEQALECNHPNCRKRRKTIGELNGPWSILFRITQVLLPVVGIILVPWTVWVTQSITRLDKYQDALLEWKRTMAPTFTASDALALRLTTIEQVEQKIKEGDKSISEKLDRMHESVLRLENEVRYFHGMGNQNNGRDPK